MNKVHQNSLPKQKNEKEKKNSEILFMKISEMTDMMILVQNDRNMGSSD